MIKRFKYIIYPLKALQPQVLLLSLAFVSCADEFEQPAHDIECCVRAAWQDGLASGHATRSLSATDILAAGTEDIAIDYADYPAVIEMECSDGTNFILSKGGGLCNHVGHTDYWSYIASVIYKDKVIKENNLTFTAKVTIDGTKDELIGECNKDNLDGTHMLLTLHHTKALLRFAFKVDSRYDKVRYIKITGIKLNYADCVLVDNVLKTTDMTYIAYVYVDPAVVTAPNLNTLECTYDIYDKDALFNGTMDASELAGHITRKDVKARNTFKFNNLMDADDNLVTEIKAGYYYDLKVTLNPDYLYVLAEHDNKHITIE